jgi:uncharacterized membrane protein YgdD (TMEM256/DUF423 family)
VTEAITTVERWSMVLAALNGMLAVALGAFGAHGLKTRLANLPDAAQRLGWWETAAQYQLAHALALGLCAQLIARGGGGAGSVAVWSFTGGIALFSGSLYAMTLGVRGLGPVTPVGGLLLLVGWGALLVAAWGLRTS